jgi:hypothetical protein
MGVAEAPLCNCVRPVIPVVELAPAPCFDSTVLSGGIHKGLLGFYNGADFSL